jgi:S-adenosylhomocysteine hydrolase
MEISRLVVLDDGGLILSWLNRAFETDLFSKEDRDNLAKLRVVSVEQTTFGRHLVEHLHSRRRGDRESFSVPIPIGNVAETRLKLEKESGLIADSVVRELDAWIRASKDRGRHIKNLHEASVGVIGFGVVGSWVCKALQQFAVQRIVVFDSDASHSSIARSVGHPVAHSVRDLASQCSVIIGCTGAPGGVELTADMLRPRTILASASSGNHEFTHAFLSSGKGHREDINPEVTPDRDASAFDWVHSIFTIRVPNGVAYVLNGGFPVNFTGAIDPIRAEDIELTRCLIVAGVGAAMRKLGDEPNFGGPVQLVTVNEGALTEMFGS